VAKGAPIVVLAQLFQVNPLHWIYRPDKTPFSGPADWKGKTIGVTFGGNDETIMRALLARYRIAENEVSLFSVRYDYTPFYEGRVAFWPLYLNAQAVIIGDKLAQAGETFDVISPDRLGVKFVVVRRQLAVTRELMLPAPGAAFGTIDLDAWKQTAQIMAAQQLIPPQLNVESVLMTDLKK